MSRPRTSRIYLLALYATFKKESWYYYDSLESLDRPETEAIISFPYTRTTVLAEALFNKLCRASWGVSLV